MFMIMFVLDDPSLLDEVLEAWSNLGVSGATIIESSGLYRRQQNRIPMRYAYGDIPNEVKGNSTLLVIVESETAIQQCLQAAEKIVGDLDKPDTGVFSAWPLTISKGIPAKG